MRLACNTGVASGQLRACLRVCQSFRSLATKGPAMKKIVPTLGWAGVVLAAGCLEHLGPGPRSYKGPLVRYHFAGQTHLPAGTNATRLKEIDALPATTALRGQIADKLAAAAW